MRKLINSLILIPAIALTYLPVSQASDTYNMAVGGIYNNIDGDNGIEITMMTLGLQYFLKPVSYDSGPYREASFLHRQSSFIGGVGTANVDFDGTDVDGTNLLAGFQFADPSQPFAASITYNTAQADDTVFGTKIEVTLDATTVQFGYYIDSHSAIGLEYTNSEVEIKISGVGGSFKGETDTYGILYKNVMDLGGDTYLNLEAALNTTENDDNDRNNEISGLVDYYFSRAGSVRAGYMVNSGDDPSAEGNTLTLGVSFFLQPTFSVGFEMQQFSSDEPNSDSDTVNLEIEGRF